TADTTQVSTQSALDSDALPTSTMMQAAPVTTTIQPTAPASVSTASNAALLAGAPETFASILSQISANPQLLAQVSTLDTAGLAALFSLSPATFQQLGLSGVQIEQIGQAVLSSPQSVRDSLAIGSIDPAALIGLLLKSVDLNSLAAGAVGALVQALLGSISDLKFVISPEVTVNLNELLDQIDPDGIAPIIANPGNAGILALIFSAVINSNPLLNEQLLANPNLDPALRPILEQLGNLGASLGSVAQAALLDAINNLFPGLLPTA
ncbi:MAG: hypothetical protein WD029_05470, partial [Microthrixaceae bacterium]